MVERTASAGPWQSLAVDDAVARLRSDTGSGLSTEEVRLRLAEHGPNVLAEEPHRALWRRLLALLTEPMTMVLLAAAVLSAVVSGEIKTPAAILVVVVLNATLNLLQERRAETSLEALREMSVTRARVRRDGHVQQVDATGLVPGDIVMLDAGDVVPADGRLAEETGLEVQEAALTGESAPVAKDVEAIPDPDVPVGDRSDMVFMSTEVTRGSGVLLVTETGMATEIGRVAGLLREAGQQQTPLQRRIAQLAGALSVGAGLVVALVVVMGLLRGRPVADVLLTGVSLAVATIPEGLTAVVAFTLAMGAARLARRGAILKDLASVETLGSTSHIATDKTGTLTLNEMTARRLLTATGGFHVSGEGYRAEGAITADSSNPSGLLDAAAGDGTPPPAAYLAMALASDAVVREEHLVGDPTEGALLVLALKAGLRVEELRRRWPRAAVVPFDSSRKYMATVHQLSDVTPPATGGTLAAETGLPLGDGVAGLMLVKGAPDVLVARSSSLATRDGSTPIDAERLARLRAANDDLTGQGLRVMALACRPLGADQLDLAAVGRMEPEDLDHEVDGLTLLALVGIVDPPRPEVPAAVAEAAGAGIAVHMITGDHVGTASAIAHELGIPGEVASGSELDRCDDRELAGRAPGLGVLARVSPEHKLRMVDALRSDGSVVAMTGDGVNDAPALKQADIGIAMGITGTEVSKGAARMILTDDNFATIVAAVREGRGIYDNIVKFVRFQITTSWGFVAIFLTAGVAGLAGGAPFTALQILWVNVIMDGPPAMALGLDEPEPGVMRRPPRPVREPILTRTRILRILVSAAVMAVGTLGVLVAAPGPAPAADVATEVGTLAFTTYVLFQVFNLLNVRSNDGSVFRRRTFTNRWLWMSLVAVLSLQVAVVHVPWLQDLFGTASLGPEQWLTAVVVASSVLWGEELLKFWLRRRS